MTHSTMSSDPYVFTGNAAENAAVGGGKKKTAPKKKAPAAAAPKKKAPAAAASKKTAPAVPKKKKTTGGAFLEDVAALSVPFSLILAKQGLDKLKKTPASAPATPSKKPTSSTKRGGSCGTSCAGNWSGGSPASAQLAKITREIDNFLSRG